MSRRPVVAVVGATGQVGAVMRRLLDERDFPTVPFYSGNPWFLPLVGAWYRTRDWWDRTTTG